VDLLFKAVRGDRTAIDQMKNSLNAKKDEFEKKLKSQATDAATQAVRENLPSVNLPKPKLPGIGR